MISFSCITLLDMIIFVIINSVFKLPKTWSDVNEMSFKPYNHIQIICFCRSVPLHFQVNISVVPFCISFYQLNFLLNELCWMHICMSYSSLLISILNRINRLFPKSSFLSMSKGIINNKNKNEWMKLCTSVLLYAKNVIAVEYGRGDREVHTERPVSCLLSNC